MSDTVVYVFAGFGFLGAGCAVLLLVFAALCCIRDTVHGRRDREARARRMAAAAWERACFEQEAMAGLSGLPTIQGPRP